MIQGLFGAVEPVRPVGFGGGIVQVEPVHIAAPPDVVWGVMTDFERYPEWNPMNRWFRCAGGIGAKAEFGVSWGPYDGLLRPSTLSLTEVVTVWEPGRCFAYADDKGRLHRAERVQMLTEAPGGTIYHTYERWRGPLTPVIARIFTRRILGGFRAVGAALRVRAESGR